MSVRRFTRLTNAFSKKMQNHCYAAALWYNFCKPHKTLKGDTPAMAAGLAEEPYAVDWIGQLLMPGRRSLGLVAPTSPANQWFQTDTLPPDGLLGA